MGIFMKKRKNIAVVAADVFNEYINKILTGIVDQGNSLGYDISVFMMTFNNEGESLLQAGEENIYTLINREAIDAAVFIIGNIASMSLREKLQRFLSGLDIPLVSVDCAAGICENLTPDDSGLFEQMTDHFIENHGCRDIICLTGYKGVPQSESRLGGYLASLRRHDIPVDPQNIIYGDFWKNAARNLASELISGERRMPDAVVCASDVMAIELCNALMSAGIKIPEDIMISGYDASLEALNNTPSITTIQPKNYELGAAAVCYLHENLTGEKAEMLTSDQSGIIAAQSCGCEDTTAAWHRTHEAYIENIQFYDQLYRSSGMTENLLEAKSLEDLLARINSLTYLINGLELYMLCLCENWDYVESDSDDEYLREGYSDKMVIKMIRSGESFFSKDIKFNTAEILPDAVHEYCKEPSAYFFLPMHFKDRCFGYSVFNFKDVSLSLSTIYAMWCRNVNVALEFMRVRTKLTSINQRIFISSIRDTLTGIYNQKGFRRLSEQIFNRARNEKKKLLIIVADLDLLKYINDNFGHIEGDNALTAAAEILNKSCHNSEICARIGGDEFAVMGCYDYTDEIISDYVAYINRYIARYNKSSRKQYELGLSFGIYCDVPSEESSFSECFDIADKLMYQNKFERRKFRKE